MASSLTNKGEELALYGTATPNGGLANLISAIKLYSSTSTPNKNGTGFTEVAAGNGYPVGGYATTRANWTWSVVSGNGKIVRADINVAASGGSIPGIGGAYAINAAGDVLGWWERTSPITLAPGESINFDDLTIGG